MDKAYKEIAGQVNPGFRKGHVPSAHHRPALRPRRVIEQVVNQVLPGHYSSDAVNEKRRPMVQPTVDVVTEIPT